jgi:hypothetical protein
MLDVVVAGLLAPALVGVATAVGRRSGPRAAGIVSAFPAIVGPVLLIDLLERGAAFTAQAAAGTLLGLVALAAFAAVYGVLAHRGPPVALTAAWSAAALAGAVVSDVEVGPWAAALAAVLALGLASVVLRVRGADGATGDPQLAASPARDAAARMAATAVLVAALAIAAGIVGPTAGGVLAALPVLASVLTVFTHRQEGARAAVALLGGMAAGMGGFALFCLLVALLVERDPVLAFAVATAAAVAAQGAAGARGDGARAAIRAAHGALRAVHGVLRTATNAGCRARRSG